MLEKIPLLAGASYLASDDNDIRRNLSIALCIGILFLLCLQGIGIEGGAVGTTITAAFMLLLGYYFGKKETEVLGK